MAFLSVRVFAPIEKSPLVSVNVPSNSRSACIAEPLALFKVKLFNALMDEGIFTPLPLPEMVMEDVLPALRLAAVPEMAFLSVRVFAPIEKSPLVRVKVPFIITSPPIPIPLPRFMVRLFKLTTGRLVLAPEPPKVILEDVPPFKEPDAAETAPLSASVLPPIEKPPLVSVNVPSNSRSACIAEPLALFKVKLFNALMDEGIFTPLPLPEMVMEDVLPALRLAAVPEMAFLSVRVFAPIEKSPLVRVKVPFIVTSPPISAPFDSSNSILLKSPAKPWMIEASVNFIFPSPLCVP